MAKDDNGEKNGRFSKINWQSLIQAGVITLVLGGGGLYNIRDMKSDLKSDMVAMETRLTKRIESIETEIKEFRKGVSNLEVDRGVANNKIQDIQSDIDDLKIEMRGR